VLDTTHPEVLAWIEEVARTLRHEWGYRILKLDFLYNAALPGRRFDSDATLATSLRLGLEAVRLGAGDDAFLLGCGCPLGPAVGIVDGMRIGADVAPYWDLAAQRIASVDEAGATTRVAIRNTLTRAFMHQRLWANDPDCVMVRTDRTRLTDAEVRSLAAAVALTDGMVVSSDRLETVPTDRLSLFSTVHRLTGGSPRVVDLLQRPMPEVVVSTRSRDILVGVFNFSDRPEQRVLDVDALGLPARALDVSEVAEVLVGGAVALQRGRADLGVLAAHDARILRFPTATH
jgi:alpha-galactosidase